MAMFAKVVDCASFSAAARVLGVSKSAVSKQVKALEESLGVQLLARSTRRFSLTQAGQLLYETCAHLVDEATAVAESLGELQRRPAGLLRINAPVELGCTRVAAVVADFLQHYPDVQIELTLQDDVVDVVGEGVDIAIRIGRLADSALISRRIGPIPLQLAASPDYLARRGVPRTHTDMRDHAFLLYSLMENPRRLELKRKGRRYSVTVDGPLTCNNGRARREAALSGLGIVHLPTFYIAEDLESGRLIRVLPDYETLKIALHAVFPPGGGRTATQRLFIEHLVDGLAPCKLGLGR